MMILPSLAKKTELTEKQKRKINHFRTIKSAKIENKAKQKYFCPIMEEGYFATPKHTICPLCYKPYEFHHEIVLFDPKIHTW